MTPTARSFAYSVFIAALCFAPARAEVVKAGDLVITQAWSRATPGGAKVGGGYLTIENKGTEADRLTGGSADAASKVEVHEMAMNNGVMTMRPLDEGLTIEPGKTVKLAPGGYHLMLLGLKSPLKQGDKLPITLEFKKAGKVKLSLDVEGLGALGPASGDMDMKRMPAAAGSPAIAGDDGDFFTHLHTEKAMANVTVSPGRVGTVDITIQLETTEELALMAKAVSVTLSNIQSGVRLQTIQAVHTIDDQWHVSMSVPSSGRWMLRLGISISDTDKVNMEAPILIR